MAAGSGHDVFLSYSWADHRVVAEVAAALRGRGLDVFLDRVNLTPGQSWVDELERRLADCRAVAVFLGLNGLGRWQRPERAIALNRKAREPDFPVIPILLPGSTP